MSKVLYVDFMMENLLLNRFRIKLLLEFDVISELIKKVKLKMEIILKSYEYVMCIFFLVILCCRLK